jgi:hypothetical protein
MRRRIIRFQISRPGVRPDHLGLRCSIRLPPWAMEHRPVVVSRGRHPGNTSATAAPDPPDSRIPERRPRLRCHSIAAWPSPPGVRIGCRPASGDEPAKWPAWPPYRTTRGASAYGLRCPGDSRDAGASPCQQRPQGTSVFFAPMSPYLAMGEARGVLTVVLTLSRGAWHPPGPHPTWMQLGQG